jgi:hypothetical protein
VTKAGGGYLSVAPGVVRVQLVTDFLGETGHGASSAAQWFALVALVGALAYGALALARDGARARPLACCWRGRYLTFLIPVGVIVLARAAVRSGSARGAGATASNQHERVQSRVGPA